MRAAVLRSFGQPLVIEDLVLHPPRRHEVRVRIGAVAVCGSDVHAGDGAWGGALPVVNGHEAAGVVAELGPGVGGVAVGDHVVVSLLRTCGECFYCAATQSHLCATQFPLDTETRLHDAHGAPVRQGIAVGGFAEEAVVHQSQVIPIDRRIPLDAASLLACGVPTGHGAVDNTAGVPEGASVVVVGVGGVGINCVQGAKAAGASPIIAVDHNATKLELARVAGATHALPSGAAVADAVTALTMGRGADFVFVAVGNVGAIEAGFELVRPGGTLVVVGMSAAGARAGFDMSDFAYSGKRIVGSLVGSTDFARDIPRLSERFFAGELLLDQLISQRYPLERINDAIASARTGEVMRNVIVFDGAAR